MLINLEYIHTRIDEQLVKNKKIQIKLINFSFEVYNADGTKNGEVTRIVLLEIEINRYKEHFKAAVTNLNGMNIFLEYNWLVKHNIEVNQKDSKIKFTKCPSSYRMKH